MGELRIPVRASVVGHLSLMASFAAVADVKMPGTLWVGALAYVLLQGGRALHEAARAWVGVRAGMMVRQVRLGMFRMSVDFAHGQRGFADASTRLRMALVGSVAQALFGAVLVTGALVLQDSRVSEPVLLVGLVHLAAVSNLVPVLGLELRVRVRPGKDLAPAPR